MCPYCLQHIQFHLFSIFVEWKQGVTPRELKSEIDIIAAQDKGDLSIKPGNVIVNCPFVKWNGGSLKEREDKTLTDQSPYGSGQVLNIDTKKNEVTFIAHRGFAPWYYLAKIIPIGFKVIQC